MASRKRDVRYQSILFCGMSQPDPLGQSFYLGDAHRVLNSVRDRARRIRRTLSCVCESSSLRPEVFRVWLKYVLRVERRATCLVPPCVSASPLEFTPSGPSIELRTPSLTYILDRVVQISNIFSVTKVKLRGDSDGNMSRAASSLLYYQLG